MYDAENLHDIILLFYDFWVRGEVLGRLRAPVSMWNTFVGCLIIVEH
jgi:hypothetical protein